MSNQNLQPFLNPSKTFDSDHPDVVNFARSVTENCSTDREKAVALYYAIRDGFKYNPFDIRFDFDNARTSRFFDKKQGHCIDKAGMMVAACRAVGIPARIGLVKVKNHMGTARLEKILRTDVLVPHGYTEVYIDDRWVKCTPAFNRSLCEKLNVEPLEWDGKNDSLFQQYDRKGAGFMEYMVDYGTFVDIPEKLVFDLMKKEYPHMIDDQGNFRTELLNT